MAKGTKTGGRDIKPGEVLNPNGARAHHPDTRRLKRLGASEVAEIGSLVLEGDLEALEAIVRSAQKTIKGLDNPEYDPKKHSVLKIWFASIAVKAIQKGDPMALTPILNRIVGRVPEEIRHTGPDGGAVMVGSLTKEQADAESRRILERIRERSRTR